MSDKKKGPGFHSPFADAADRLKKVVAPKEPPKPAISKPKPFTTGREAVHDRPYSGKPGAAPDSAQRLWEDAIGGVRPLAPTAPRAAPGREPPEIVTHRAARSRTRDDAETDAALADLVAGAGQFELLEHDDTHEGLAPGVDRRLLKKLRAGEYPIEGQLDLHGLGVPAAEAAVTRFVTESRKLKRRCILVIHGRGLNSDAGPILKDRLRDWLSSARVARGVLAFTGARPADGGPGASYVLLRKLTS